MEIQTPKCKKIGSESALSEQSFNQSIEEPAEKTVPFLSLFRFASKKQIGLIIFCVLCSAAMGAAIPVFAFITGDMLDAFQEENEGRRDVKQHFYNYLILGGSVCVVGMVMIAGWMISGEKQALRCRKQYFKSLVGQDIAWYDTHSQAEIVSNFSKDTMSFQLAVGEKISNVITIITMLLIGLVLSIYLGWILTLVMLGCLPIIGFCWYKNVSIRNEIRKEEEQIFKQSDSRAQQSYSGIRVVKQMNAQQFQSALFASRLNQIKEKILDNGYKYSFGSFIAYLSLYISLAFCFWYGGECVFDTKLCPKELNWRDYSVGTVFKIFYSLFIPAFNLNQLTPSLQKIAEGKEAAARIFAIIDRVPKVQSKPTAYRPETVRGIIEFKEVSFAYPKSKKVKILDKLNMKIDCQHSALVGRSGCGKSTVFQLIMRFYDPDEGAIFLDGIDLRDLDLEWLRAQIGYVTQEPILFATSIRENMLLGKSDASEEEMEEALKKAEAWSFISELKDKLDTYVGTEGSMLSGGQKQRISIGRALLKKPKILLLDEATSALDRQNEREIMNTLKRVGQQFVSLSITHREYSLITSDKIYYFKKGKIAKIVTKPSKQPQQFPQHELPLVQQEQQEMVDQFDGSISLQNIFADFLRQQKNEEIIQPPTFQLVNSHIYNNANTQDSLDQTHKKYARLSRIWQYVKTQKRCLILAIILSILDALTFPLIGAMLAQIIVSMFDQNNDQEKEEHEIRIFSLVIAGLALWGASISGVRQFIFSILGQHTSRTVKVEAFDKIMKMPVSWFERKKNQPQKLTTTVTQGCRVIQGFTQRYIAYLILIILNILFSLIGAVAFEWRTGLTAVGLVPLIILSQAIQLAFIKGLTESKDKIYGESSQIVSESVMNIRTVYSLGSIDLMCNRYSDKLQQIEVVILKRSFISGFMFGFSYLLQFAVIGLLFFLASIYVTNHDVQIQNSLTAIFLIVLAGISAGNSTNYLEDLSVIRAGAKSIFSIIDQEDEDQMQIRTGSKMLTQPIKGNIEFKNVGFRYESRESNALSNINLDIREGQKVAFVGASGCGKSTIFQLLLGFYRPTEGYIFLEGHEIRDYDIHHLRKSFGVVSQEPVLFNESIEWNIRYNMQEASSEEVIEAAEKANFRPYERQKNVSSSLLGNQKLDQMQSARVMHSDEKIVEFQKNVGPKGSHVSGGQKQRIAIARTILRDPTILLLDEATSALDIHNEFRVQNSLDQVMQGKSTISITHRLQSVDFVDRIYMLDHGKIQEKGTLKQLLLSKGSFFQLYKGKEQ